MKRTNGIHIFIISLMLAMGCGFLLWGTVLHNKAGNTLEIQKSKKHKASTATNPVPMHESQIGFSKSPAFRVNTNIREKKATVQRGYVSESETRRLTIAPHEMSQIASRKSLTVADLSLIEEDAILDSGIEERNIGERIGQFPVDSPFPLRKGNSYVSFPQKGEPLRRSPMDSSEPFGPAIAIPFKTMASESDLNSRIAGSSGRRRNKANTSKGEADGGSYSSPKKSGLKQRSDDEFVFEAEDASSLTPYFEIGQDKYASNSKYISTPETGDATALNGVGNAEYRFEVKKAGVYKVFGRVLAPTAGSNSFYIRMDNGPQYAWDLQESRYWVWAVATQGMGRNISDLTFELEVGSHILRIGNREDGTMLDILVILRLSN